MLNCSSIDNGSYYKLRIEFPRPKVDDVSGATERELQKIGDIDFRNKRIAVAVGSRGITCIVPVVKATIAWLRLRGAQPFIIPAMGSHGGATADGQREVLRSYAIEESTVGAPVRSQMDTVIVATLEGMPVHMDRLAYEADGVLLINRVKPHTDFHGNFESGLIKMCVIGLGKNAGASETHLRGVYGLRELIPKAAGAILGTKKIIGGIAILENAYGETAHIEMAKVNELFECERSLLVQARTLQPFLPADEFDILIVDRIGKDICGVGMDPGVIGRMKIDGEPEPSKPRIRAIIACDLTERSHGNALGVGFADVITHKLFSKINIHYTYTNVLAATFVERAKIPAVAPTDRDAFELAMRVVRITDRKAVRVARIRDTLDLNGIWVSGALLKQLDTKYMAGVTASAPRLFEPDGSFMPFGEF